MPSSYAAEGQNREYITMPIKKFKNGRLFHQLLETADVSMRKRNIAKARGHSNK